MASVQPSLPDRAKRLQRILIPNRGEIALRVIRACHDLGLTAILAHSDADRDSLPMRMADESVCLGPALPRASYLNADAVIAAALACSADAIHPGYGFLSENPRFIARCEEAGIVLIGPRPAGAELMGNKMKARAFAASVGLPLVPGSEKPVSPDHVVGMANTFEYPVIIKAAAGGGGRGMRLANDAASLVAQVASASAEAESAFGDGSIYVEKYLANARHVEVQVAFDERGGGIHLGERDCTIQRRYQKLVEEAPSAAIDDALREAMGHAALTLCREAHYRGVGTVEFLYDQDSRSFYFIEMNTRLQVEHPVTELVTGIDLVTLQFLIAEGCDLPLAQAEVGRRGHAIEFRVNAEDPTADFRPASGTVEAWSPPLGPGVRVDTHCYVGYRVPPFYDSLLAKVVVWGASRAEALARARRALGEFEIGGIRTTLPFHQWLLDQQDFIEMKTNTGWAEAHLPREEVK
jgi:acetyl-CoA carboxylase biotin carboxylase subunit